MFTVRLQAGLGLLAFGVGLMFLAAKVLSAPSPAGIASGIATALVGFVLTVSEAIRAGPAGPGEADSADDPRANRH